MSRQQTTAELGERIEALRARLARTAEDLVKDGELTYSMTDMEARARALQDKLPADGSSLLVGVREEVERDLHALEADVSHWLAYIDRHFADQQKTG
ncbi:MAG: hypothetical protein R3D65_02465 [Zhengella sp.]|uniref:hypothetical protein n=1 Tax=Zhengella sp. TaxID=2282762 RepID=UPI001E197D69|nr:hypothetical protein [Notoacmeibacter sp.]MCC0026400.1 hypothetical protein [Brucellaceae bacterium]